MDDCRLAAIACPAVPGAVAGNLAGIIDWIEAAAAAGAQVVAFPEAGLTGYDLDRWREHAISRDDPSLERIRAAAAPHDLVAAVGFLEREADRCYVSQAWLGAGISAIYRKCHRTGWEQQHCHAGGDLPVFDLGRLQVGTLICYDSAFPRACETLVLRGAELLLTPTCHGVRSEDLERVGARALRAERRAHVGRYWRARAYDYSCFACYVDTAGSNPSGTWFSGYAAIFAPDGSIVAERDDADLEPGMIIADLSAAAMTENQRRQHGHWKVLGDRRPELYAD